MAELKFIHSGTMDRLMRMQELLRQSPKTLHEMADGIGTSERYARLFLDYLREEGLVTRQTHRREIAGARKVAVYEWTGGGIKVPETGGKLVSAAEEAAEIREAEKRAQRIQPHTDWTSSWIPRRAAS